VTLALVRCWEPFTVVSCMPFVRTGKNQATQNTWANTTPRDRVYLSGVPASVKGIMELGINFAGRKNAYF